MQGVVGVGGEHKIEGTAEYISPEVAAGAAAPSYASDAWAFGCVIFQLLAGHVPTFSADCDSLLSNAAGTLVTAPVLCLALALALALALSLPLSQTRARALSLTLFLSFSLSLARALSLSLSLSSPPPTPSLSPSLPSLTLARSLGLTRFARTPPQATLASSAT
jgi:serine/threonine protein kinase